MDRFELERAMETARLKSPAKALFYSLCRRIHKTGVILPHHRPSVTELSRAAGLCRTATRNNLYRLEKLGWITSFPPDPADARRTWARTEYILHAPGSPEHLAARAQQPAEQRREARRARAAKAQAQARARKTAAQPADTAGSATPPAGPVSPGRLGGAVLEEAAALGRPVTPAQAGEIARQILAGKNVRRGSEESYVRTSVRKSAAKYLPTPAGPPPPPRVAQPAPPDLAHAGATQARERLANRDRKR